MFSDNGYSPKSCSYGSSIYQTFLKITDKHCVCTEKRATTLFTAKTDDINSRKSFWKGVGKLGRRARVPAQPARRPSLERADRQERPRSSFRRQCPVVCTLSEKSNGPNYAIHLPQSRKMEGKLLKFSSLLSSTVNEKCETYLDMQKKTFFPLLLQRSCVSSTWAWLKIALSGG